MDSGNSGSMQSSSTAGDEEYDSRAESSSISAFIKNNNVNPVPPPPQPPTTTLIHHVAPFTQHVFDPLSNYLDPTQRTAPSNTNQILNLDMVWSKVAAAAARSEPDLGAAFMTCSSSSSPHTNHHHHNNNNNSNNQAFMLSQLGTGQSVGVGVEVSTTSFSTALVSDSGGNGVNTNTNAVRNPKKRSRASRRAPTTVLTTDTTNFRAMVQEFTGIPAPPFTSSPFPRTRLDLFASSVPSSSPPIMRSTSTHLHPPITTTTTTTSSPTPPYLLRPFPHKVQSQPSIPPMLDTLASHNSSTNNNFHNPLNMHNPILSLQSMLHPHPKFNNPSLLVASKAQQQHSLEIPLSGVDSSHLRMGGLEELGLSHAHVGGHHQNLVQSSSDLALSRVNNSNSNLNNNSNMSGPSSADWAQAQAQRIGSNDGGVLRSLSGGTLNYRSNVPVQRVSNGSKVDFSGGAASDFHGDKGPECAVVARSEGMVESWINCSSD